MKPFLTSNLKVKFLGIIPLLKDRSGVLNPQEIVALSSQTTFKGKAIEALLQDIKKSGDSVEERIKKTLQRSSLRGHASLATTPAICLTYEGSKFLDSALTGIYFSSSLMSSGRRTNTTCEDIVFPEKIFKHKKAKKLYQRISENLINLYNYFLSQGVKKDEVSKLLQYGIYGTGIINLPVESIIGLKREYEAEKEWMPDEVGILLSKIEKELKKMGIDWLYATRQAAPRNVYPYPNIFKNPKETNFVRELRKSEKLPEGAKLIFLEARFTPELKNKLENLFRESKKTFGSSAEIKRNWLKLISLRQKILRDYNLTLKFQFLSAIPWRVWGEKKRHRTCPQIIESIYYCVDRAARVFKEVDEHSFIFTLRSARVNEDVFSLPPSIKKNPQFLAKYLSAAREALKAYQELIKMGIPEREAIFLVPRAVKIDILQEYDLYNLLTGYYPLRLCTTAEEEMQRMTWKEVIQLKKAFSEKGLDVLNNFLQPKCHIMGFCPEEKFCNLIRGAVKNYNEKFHEEMKQGLKNKLEENLKKLGRWS